MQYPAGPSTRERIIKGEQGFSRCHAAGVCLAGAQRGAFVCSQGKSIKKPPSVTVLSPKYNLARQLRLSSFLELEQAVNRLSACAERLLKMPVPPPVIRHSWIGGSPVTPFRERETPQAVTIRLAAEMQSSSKKITTVHDAKAYGEHRTATGATRLKYSAYMGCKQVRYFQN